MKIRKFLLGLIAMALLCVISPVHAEETNADFDQFMRNEFIQMMEDDYMSLHFALKDYEKYGITKPQPTIGEPPTLDNSKSIAKVEESLKELEKFNYDELSDVQQHDYDTYKYYLESTRELLNYPMFDFQFLPNRGIQSNLITNFTEFIFYKQEDINDYLSVLESVPAYIEGALEVTRTQVANGYFMTDAALDSTLDGIEKFVAKTDNNPLIQIFNQNIDKFEGLTEEQRVAYKEKNRNFILNTFIPEYQKLAQELETFRGTRTSLSLYDLPDGKEYYAALLRSKSSSSASLQELFELTDEQLKKLIDEARTLYLNAKKDDNLEETLPEKDPTENDAIVAYYMQPPIDDIVNNVIKINGANVNSTNEMFTTLAHEGFPGHLFQITWYLNTNPNPLRTQLSNIGYTEGWAMYCEDVAWAYSELNDGAKEENRINTNLNYILPAQADFLVNGLGWDEKKLGKYYESLGLNAAAASNVIKAVTQEPASIVPYGVGLTYYLHFRDQAKAALGRKFDVVEFNRMLLTHGDRPFDIVQKDLEKYLEASGVSATTSTSNKPFVNPGKIGLWVSLAATVLILVVVFIRKKKENNYQ